MRFRDIHLFNENLPSRYITKKAGSDTCTFFTLPFVDGYIWSTKEKIAGLRFKARVNGKEIFPEGGDPVIQDSLPGTLHISWPLTSFAGTLVMDIDERQIKMKLNSREPVDWFLELTTADHASLPFKNITSKRVDCRFDGMDYQVTTTKGNFSKSVGGGVFSITPEMNTLILNLGHP